MFRCDSYFFDPLSGERITLDTTSKANCVLVVVLIKPPELVYELDSSEPRYKDLVGLSVFNEQPHSKLLLDAKKISAITEDNASFFEAIREKNYSLALRKACAVGDLDLVTVMLKYKHSLNININDPSAKNGYTALDWINANKKVGLTIKERIISLLLKHGASSGMLNEPSNEKVEACILNCLGEMDFANQNKAASFFLA